MPGIMALLFVSNIGSCWAKGTDSLRPGFKESSYIFLVFPVPCFFSKLYLEKVIKNTRMQIKSVRLAIVYMCHWGVAMKPTKLLTHTVLTLQKAS